LKRHKDLTRRDQSEDRPFSHVWYQLTEAWFKSDKARETPSAEPTSNYQYLHIIDNKIQEALKYEEARAIDMAYAAAVGGEIEERLKAPVRLHDSGNSGDGWSIDVKAEDIMERFWNVIALGPEIVDTEDDIWPAESASKKKTDVLEEIGKVMEAAYYRYLDPGEADREARMVGVPDEDDDSTSDYEEDDIGEDEDNDNSSDTMDGSENEDEDDLDVTALQTDMYLDVEAIREQLADSQVTVSETQASSQTLRGEESTQE
jgi:hypothetical protein